MGNPVSRTQIGMRAICVSIIVSRLRDGKRQKWGAAWGAHVRDRPSPSCPQTPPGLSLEMNDFVDSTPDTHGLETIQLGTQRGRCSIGSSVNGSKISARKV